VKNQPYEYLGKFGDIQNIEKSSSPSHAVGSCGKLWRFFFKSLVFGYCISPKKREILREYSFSKVFFAKWRKSNTKKIIQ
jgi:hypothetical protein